MQTERIVEKLTGYIHLLMIEINSPNNDQELKSFYETELEEVEDLLDELCR